MFYINFYNIKWFNNFTQPLPDSNNIRSVIFYILLKRICSFVNGNSTATMATEQGQTRAAMAGFWKSTGRDTAVYDKSKLIGIRTTLAFYKGRAELSRSCVNIYFNLMQMVLHSLLSIISLSLSVSQLLR